MVPSRFLKKEDFPKPTLVTIKRFEQDNVAPEDKPKEMKWVVHFHELDRGMVLNPTNIQLLKVAVGSNDPDQAVGKKIVVFTDPTIAYAGKITGGLRVRAPMNQQLGVEEPEPATAEDVPY